MVSKKNNQARKVRAKPKSKTKLRPVRAVVSALDNGARAYARMLLDPCNAPLCPPVYTGMGTGQYRRFRKVFSPSALAAEGCYIFTPGSNIQLAATHVAANVGNPYTFNKFTIFDAAVIGISTLGAGVETRCLAACVKIRYIGPESARSGVVGTRTTPFAWAFDGTVSNNVVQLGDCAVINRTGEVMHEVKFTPGVGDELFSPADGSVAALTRQQGSMGFAWSGMTGGDFQVEVTAILEVETTAGLVPAPVVPTSKNSLNQVLVALGPPANWAYGHIVAPTLRSIAGAAMQTVTSGVNTMSVGARLLTL